MKALHANNRLGLACDTMYSLWIKMWHNNENIVNGRAVVQHDARVYYKNDER